ncbi:hypothetical protein DP116_15525 [Brasilonema bromeliae SPC951]|uniref:Uncharacterized protein n=1 Tax=Brasilonema bromeliae SPC951 TaxID=385972 RepID=A0ABX1PB86_9CYAN|nr:hypothetical protein [Brasilonema bromeliae SPC951]
MITKAFVIAILKNSSNFLLSLLASLARQLKTAMIHLVKGFTLNSMHARELTTVKRPMCVKCVSAGATGELVRVLGTRGSAVLGSPQVERLPCTSALGGDVRPKSSGRKKSMKTEAIPNELGSD